MPEPLARSVQRDATQILTQETTEDAGARNIAHEIRVVIGDTVDVIHNVAEELDADLLIVGRHRRRVFLDHIKETTMEHLIRASARPVLLVVDAADAPYAHVLGGVDLSEVCAAGLHKIGLVAPSAEVTLFHAHEVSFRKEAERDYETWKAVSKLPERLPAPIFVEARARDALEDVMAQGAFDLLVIGAYTRSNAGRYFLGGFSSGLIRNPPCDLLLAK